MSHKLSVMNLLPPIRSWKKRNKFVLLAVLFFSLLSVYPVFVLGYTWMKVLQSDLPGGRHGPLDAYRHTLASAIVAHTFNEDVVDWVGDVMEDDGYVSQRMDKHNNRIGAGIGTRARTFFEIEAAVAKRVSKGRVMARDPEQSTWLPKVMWKDGKMW